jgi:hypothetical protein
MSSDLKYLTVKLIACNDYVLYLSKAAQHFLEGHIRVMCKDLKKKPFISFAENQNLPFKRTQFMRRCIDLLPKIETYATKSMQISNITTAATSSRDNSLDA